MKKTYVTTMPDHIGAFLKASRCFAELGVNITRVSYNKAVDAHMLFIDAEGSAERLEAADGMLRQIGYLPKEEHTPHVVLIEFRLLDVPGSVNRVLELIERFHFNISYMSSQQTEMAYQWFKMGLLIEDAARLSEFLDEAEKLCKVRVIDYDRAARVFDNSIFYHSFVSSLAEAAGLSDQKQEELLVNTNLAMQLLDESGLSPHSAFESIRCFAELIAACKGAAFAPRVTTHMLTEWTELTLIEPDCGSNTAVLRSGGELLFIDTGYACYREEMLRLLRSLFPGFDRMKKRVLITHADVDHCGLLSLFDEIIASSRTADCLRLEYEGQDGFREQIEKHKPYIRICKTLTAYAPPPPERVVVPWKDTPPWEEALRRIGSFPFGDLTFSVLEGRGGHLPGEIILVDAAHRIAFTGDVYINVRGLTSAQKQYNRYAPILMSSVDTDPILCTREREAFFAGLAPGCWRVFGAHGAMKEHTVEAD